MSYNKVNNLVGWGVFALSFITYLLTVSPTGSFWDCGEFLAVSNELEVPHPPGAPLYLLLGRIFAIFSFGNVENIAFMVNLLSVVSSAFTSLFTCWIITMLGKKLISPDGAPTQSQTIGLMFAGLVGGMTCTFCDSIWFNAVEAEVYAISSFFTAIVVWLMLKWEARADEPDHFRWILLIAYVMGLSVGVHLLNLLAIPSLGMIYYFRKYEFSWKGFAATMGISVLILGLFNSGIIKYTFDFAWRFESFFTGTYDIQSGKETGMGMPFGTGSAIFTLLFAAGLLGGIYYSIKNKIVWLNVALLGTVMVYLGISSYALILIRSKADTPINENNPSNLLNYLSYMKREQYGDWPILYGPMYNAEPIDIKDKKPAYYKFNTPQKSSDWTGSNVDAETLNKKYVIYDESPTYLFSPGSERILPRMHSAQHYTGKGLYSYINYVKNKGSDPADPRDDKPTTMDNLRFFFDYQFSYMYVRYFLWNFVGRSGDEQGRNDGWESGIIPQSNLPDYMKNDPSKNHYFFFPLILGILGLTWQYGKSKKDTAVIGALFFFTGIAIILYLNQTPSQPRERDYSYAGSFQTYCIWIGLGVLALAELINKFLKNFKHGSLTSGVVSLALVPGIMGAQNWHDHSRAGNYMAPDSAYNMLMSCDKDAILFTNGDNDTFPLWYLQEVEGVRTDVRIVNLSLLNTDWYIHQLKMQCNDSPPLPITLKEKDYMGEVNATVAFKENTFELLPVSQADIDNFVSSKIINPEDLKFLEAPMRWKVKTRGSAGRTYLQKQDFLIHNIMKNIAAQGWKRPIYFATTIPSESFVGLNPYFQLEGMAYRVLPIKDQRQRGNERMNLEKTYNLQLKTYRLRGLDDPNVFYASDIKRMIGNLRYNYIRLATGYLEAADEIKVELDNSDKRTEKDSVLTFEGKIPNPFKGKPFDENEKNAMNQKIAFYKSRAAEVIRFISKKVNDKTVRIEPYYLAQYARVYAETGDLNEAKITALEANKRLKEDFDYETSSKVDEVQNAYFTGIYSLLELCKTHIKDPQARTTIAQTSFQMFTKSLENATQSLNQEEDFRFLGGIGLSVMNFYAREMNDRKSAEMVANAWKNATGSDELGQELRGERNRQPSKEEIEAMKAQKAAEDAKKNTPQQAPILNIPN